MSLATVKAHVSRLLAKLGAENRVQIALLVQTLQPAVPITAVITRPQATPRGWCLRLPALNHRLWRVAARAEQR